MHAINDVATERLQTDSKIFAFTRWDIVPVAAELLDLTYFSRTISRATHRSPSYKTHLLA